MKILILDGNPNPENKQFDQYLENLKKLLKSNHHEIERIRLKDQDIKYCTGCWSCWVKTPGECAFKDDSHQVCREYINSDFVLFASPVIMGFPSAVLKKTMDKLIPLVHPYIEIVNGECHHIKRYSKYPRLGLLLEKSSDTDEEDIQIISDIYQRFALNLKSKHYFTKLTTHPIEEVLHAINAI